MSIKKIAVITMARNDEFFLNRWVKYYGEQFGEENLYIYLDGLDQQAPAEAGKTNVKIVEKQGVKVVDAEKRRLDFLSDRAAELFSAGYELVIGCDADEFLIVDSRLGKTLAEYLSSLKINISVSPLGLDVGSTTVKVVVLDEDGALLFSRYERHNSEVHTTVSALLTEVNETFPGVSWRMSAAGSGNLYLLHLGNIDYDALMEKFNSQDIVARGEQAHYRRARFRVIDSISEGNAVDGDKVFEKARKIQTVFRPVYAWNKPSMLGMRWIVKLPEWVKGIRI